MAKKDLTYLTMDFYDDIDVDFGDKEELGVGDMISLLEKTSISKSKSQKKPKKPAEIMFEDEVASDEYEYYEPPNTDYLSYPADPDFVDSIAREVSEVTGNVLLNEQLENHYRQQFPASTPKKTSKKKITAEPKANLNITKKSELRKEMAFPLDDSKVTFAKRNRSNALVNSVALAEKKKEIVESLELPENNTESFAAIEEQTDSPLDSNRSYAYERCQLWVNNLNDSVEDEFYSANDTTTDSSYFTASASASETETPKRTYRATSKRLAKKPSPAPKISDAIVGFKISPKVTPPAPPKPTAPKPAPSTKLMTTKNTKIYIPGSYNREFQMKPSDFPAIR